MTDARGEAQESSPPCKGGARGGRTERRYRAYAVDAFGAVVFGCLVLIAAGTARAEPRSVDPELTPVAVPAPSALALRYYRTGNWIWAGNQLMDVAVPALLLISGASARLWRAADRAAQHRAVPYALRVALCFPIGVLLQGIWVGIRHPGVAIGWLVVTGVGSVLLWRAFGSASLHRPIRFALYIALYLAIVFLINLPVHYYQGYIRPHAYGLSNQTLARWAGNALKALGVSIAASAAFGWVPFVLIARAPRWWWLYLTLLAMPFLFGVVLVKPVWVDPLFNRFGPMHNVELEHKILALAGRAGIDGGRVFEVDKSRDTKSVNAYVTGVLGTKRIVLWDTLLAKLDERGVLFVMAHEMGHYVLGHVVRGVLLSSLAILCGLWFVDRAGRWALARWGGAWGVARLSDVAATPLILLLMHVAALALAPAVNAYIRHQEFEADRFALELTQTNHSGARAFVTLQAENLSNPRPGLFYKVFRATHPSIGERIDFCNAYHPWTSGAPLVYGELFRH